MQKAVLTLTARKIFLALPFIVIAGLIILMIPQHPQEERVPLDAQESLRQVMIQSDDSVVLPFVTMEIKDGDINTSFFGVRNDRPYASCVISAVRCIGVDDAVLTAARLCAPGVPIGALVGDPQRGENLAALIQLQPAHLLKPKDIGLWPMIIQGEIIPTGHYTMELIVAERLAADPTAPADAADCGTAVSAIDPVTGALSPGWGAIARKQFRITVN